MSRRQRTTFVLDHITAAPVGAVKLVFGDDGIDKGPWAYTRACIAVGIVRQREVHHPSGDGFDRIGARMDWNDSIVPIHNMLVDESFDFDINEQTMIVTPQTSMWEIQHKLGDYTENEVSKTGLSEVILDALRRVGIYPQ